MMLLHSFLWLLQRDVVFGCTPKFLTKDSVKSPHGGKPAFQRTVGVGMCPFLQQKQGVSQPQDIEIAAQADAEMLLKVAGEVALAVPKFAG